MQSLDAQRSIDGLIKAERDFAAYSVANSTKEAFLKFLDSTGIVFDNGKAINGIETWNKKEKRPGVLNWWPLFAEISDSNDFGYTTGQWIFQQSATDTVAARGQYTTVWHINKNDEWKFLVDLGVNNTPVNSSREAKIINVTKQEIKKGFIPHVLPYILAENNFIKAFEKNKAKAYKKYLSGECILNRNGNAPAADEMSRQELINSTSPGTRFTLTGWGIASGEDIAYVYGTAILNGKTENYLRVWRHEKDGWKIALEVLRY